MQCNEILVFTYLFLFYVWSIIKIKSNNMYILKLTLNEKPNDHFNKDKRK